MKAIFLRLSEEMFFKLKEYKIKLEKKLGKRLTWEECVLKVFGFIK
jgi:hypothetical protein